MNPRSLTMERLSFSQTGRHEVGQVDDDNDNDDDDDDDDDSFSFFATKQLLPGPENAAASQDKKIFSVQCRLANYDFEWQL